MELADDLVLPRIRCAAVHGSTGADPGGSAPVWDAVLVVEVPLPWGRDICMSAPYSALVDTPSATIDGADGRRWRPQGVVPPRSGDAGSHDRQPVEHTRVMAFERPAGGTGPFTRREWLLAATAGSEEVAGLCTALLSAEPGQVAAFDAWRDDAPAGTVDLLMCTHGSRDVCCGGSGAAAFHELVGRLGAEHVDGVRLWRTSHAGGHRFAPTAISLPDGYSWAHLTASVAEQVVRRQGEAAEVAPHCRGCVTVDGAPAQMADREALGELGWEWLGAERRAVVVAHERDTLATTVDVTGALAGRGVVGVSVRVELDRHIAMPTCGVVDGPEFATEPVWRAAKVERLAC